MPFELIELVLLFFLSSVLSIDLNSNILVAYLLFTLSFFKNLISPFPSLQRDLMFRII